LNKKNIAAAMKAHMITPTTANVPATADLLAQKPSDVAAATIAVPVALDDPELDGAVEVTKSMVNVVELVAALISVVALTISEDTAVVVVDENVGNELLLDVDVVVGVWNGGGLDVDEEVVIALLEDVLVEEAIDVLGAGDTKDCEENVDEKEPLLDSVEIVDTTVDVEKETDDSRSVNDEASEKEASVVLALADEPGCWSTWLAEFGGGGPLPPPWRLYT
jgi:hypothetical protein